MKQCLIFFFLLSNLCLRAQPTNGKAITSNDSTYLKGKHICWEMLDNVDSIQSMALTLKRWERTVEEAPEQISSFKIQRNPFKVYIYQNAPKTGLEILFKTGENDDKMLINPTGFPWINVNLNPLGNTAREGQHHSIYDAGFNKVCDVLKHLIDKYKNLSDTLIRFDSIINYVSEYDTVPCAVITFQNPLYTIETYTVKANEDLDKISKNRLVCAYKTLELNLHKLDDYEDVEENDIIFIQNDYARSMKLLIDLKNFVPRKVEVYDEKGLFESYEYLKVVVNPSFTNLDFDEANAEYGF